MAEKSVMQLELYTSGDQKVQDKLRTDLHEALAEAELDAELTVVDVLAVPGKALDNDIFATPTLLRIFPGPVMKVIANAAQLGCAVLVLTPRVGGDEQ